MENWDKLWEGAKWLLALITGGIGVEFYRKYAGKKKESLEISNLYLDAENSKIQLKTNINEIINEKTNQLQTEIATLNRTIVQISTKYSTDLSTYLKRMGDLEEKVDGQRDRADKIEQRSAKIEEQKQLLETNLEEEIKLRKVCIKQLIDLQARVRDLEQTTFRPDIKLPDNEQQNIT